MPTFLQPQSLINALRTASLTLTYSYEGSNPLKCLFQNCAALAAETTYTSADYPNASKSTYGCWFPVVTSQNDLNSNYTLIVSGTYRNYLFFKLVNGVDTLCETTALGTGFANGTPVQVPDGGGKLITTGNMGGAQLQLQEDGGTVIIVGILDVGLPDKR